MKISELQAGQIYSYGNSANRVDNRVPIIPLVTDEYLQVATDRQQAQGKPFLFRHDRRTFSSGDPERGLLVLLSRSSTPEALELLRRQADFRLSLQVPEQGLTASRTNGGISWYLLNPAWIREPWEDHLDRLQEIKTNAVLQQKVLQEKAAQRAAEATKLSTLLRLKDVRGVQVDRNTGHQCLPNGLLIQILERIR